MSKGRRKYERNQGNFSIYRAEIPIMGERAVLQHKLCAAITVNLPKSLYFHTNL